MAQSGSFAQLTVPDVFRNLILSGATGRLKVAAGPYRRTVWFDKGRPIYAASTHPEQSFGEVLVRAGKVTPEQLRQALSAAPSSRKVGVTLVELGFVKPEDLLWATTTQVREIILSLFTLADGSFAFEEMDPTTDDIVRLNLKTDALVREGVRRMTDPRLLLRALGSMEMRLEAPAARTGAFPLAEGEKGLFESLRRGKSSVRDLCRGSGMPAMDACRTLVALLATGAARRTEA